MAGFRFIRSLYRLYVCFIRTRSVPLNASLEMQARMIVTGFIIDPDTTVHDFVWGSSGVVPLVQRRLARANTTLRRNTSRASQTTGWRGHQRPDPSLPKPNRLFNTSLPEAPFQQAVSMQKNMAHDNRPYLRHSWHRVDIVAILAFWVTFILAVTHQETLAGRHIYIFRALSILRTGRLLMVTSGTMTILRSLKRAGPTLLTVGFFVIFAFAIFSIIGVQSFRGSFRRQCQLQDPNNSSNVIPLDQLCGGYLNGSTLGDQSYIQLNGQAWPLDAKGYICPLDQMCIVSPLRFSSAGPADV